MNPFRGGWFIALTLFVALVLTVVHLPEWLPQWLGWGRPHWTVVFVFYWVLHLPHRLGLIWAWVLGLLVDVLLADPLGLNAMILAAVTYITWNLYERLRMYTLLQQCVVVFGLAGLAELVRAIAHVVLSGREVSLGILACAMVSALVWPFANALLQRLQQQFRVE